MRDYKPNGTVRVSREFDREVPAHRRGYTGTQEPSPLERAAERLIELIEAHRRRAMKIVLAQLEAARNPVAPTAIDEVIELLQEASK